MHLNLAEVLDELKCVNEAGTLPAGSPAGTAGTPWRTRVEARLAELKKPRSRQESDQTGESRTSTASPVRGLFEQLTLRDHFVSLRSYVPGARWLPR